MSIKDAIEKFMVEGGPSEVRTKERPVRTAKELKEKLDQAKRKGSMMTQKAQERLNLVRAGKLVLGVEFNISLPFTLVTVMGDCERVGILSYQGKMYHNCPALIRCTKPETLLTTLFEISRPWDSKSIRARWSQSWQGWFVLTGPECPAP